MTTQDVILVVSAILASSGLWAIMSKILDKPSTNTQMLIGLGHDRIVHLAKVYIERGWVTVEEYENLHYYLFTPYVKIGGNGTAKGLMNKVDQLPIKPNGYKGD